MQPILRRWPEFDADMMKIDYSKHKWAKVWDFFSKSIFGFLKFLTLSGFLRLLKSLVAS
jgi:hypothetical protein